ncbi:ABC transporter permease [Clostridium sporogenes]|uniref:ABC transporter permease n=1 Tax=Clostridium sporogenes TaxID=1509 RepID=UPI001C11892E|nr:ABC transporter permease [Clostridium sporogenes]MBU5301013.1 ABC transporter permease [Clostridium sporogenes]MCW6078019.1 ABC transporter permease [Clostridium sporogenes]HDK7166957.1 ABC transporter permease [Clostridium botulinum]
MGNLIRGEFYKIRKSKYFIGMIFLALGASSFLINSFDVNAKSLIKISSEIPNGMHSIRDAFEWIPGTSFIFALFAAEFIAKDLKNNMSKSFIYGYKRSKVILSKLIVFIISSLFLQLIYTTILVTYVSINYGFGEALNYSTILYLIRVIIIGIMYNVATISIVAMIAIITKNNLCTIVSPILFILSFSALTFSVVKLNSSHISAIITYVCPFIIGKAAMVKFAPKSHIIIGIISSVAIFTITTLISLSYVKHKDIK